MIPRGFWCVTTTANSMCFMNPGDIKCVSFPQGTLRLNPNGFGVLKVTVYDKTGKFTIFIFSIKINVSLESFNSEKEI